MIRLRLTGQREMGRGWWRKGIPAEEAGPGVLDLLIPGHLAEPKHWPCVLGGTCFF